MFNIGVCYYNGTGFDHNQATAIAWFRKSADAGYERAHEQLQLMATEAVGEIVGELSALAARITL